MMTLDLSRRELILGAAGEVFAELGYRQTNAEDILAAAGMAAAIRGQKGWGRQTYTALRALLERVAAGAPDARIVLVEAPNAGAAAMVRYEELGEASVAWLCRGRRQYPAAADLPGSFERMVVDGVAFLLRRCLLDSPRPEMPQLLHETGRYIIEPFVGPVEFRRLASEFAESSSASGFAAGPEVARHLQPPRRPG